MITLPKPKFAKSNVPIGKSIDDYKDEISDMQTHALKDAIDRVSFRGFLETYQIIFSNVIFLKYFFSLFIHPQLIQLVF